MRGWLSKVWRQTQSYGTWQRSEYRASMDSLNLFFGAITGVAFSDLGSLPTEDYSALLVITALLVALILTFSNTRRRLMALLNLLLGLAGYWYLCIHEEAFGKLPQTVFPTLLV